MGCSSPSQSCSGFSIFNRSQTPNQSGFSCNSSGSVCTFSDQKLHITHSISAWCFWQSTSCLLFSFATVCFVLLVSQFCFLQNLGHNKVGLVRTATIFIASKNRQLLTSPLPLSVNHVLTQSGSCIECLNGFHVQKAPLQKRDGLSSSWPSSSANF